MIGPPQIVLPVAAGVVVILTVASLLIRYSTRKFQEEIRTKLAGKQVVRSAFGANFFGRSSRGMGQWRGNGALVLTTSELQFVMFAPRIELVIPLETVTSVSTPRSHLGKTVVVRLLRVGFRSPEREDAAAWAVKDVDEWVSSIQRYRSR